MGLDGSTGRTLYRFRVHLSPLGIDCQLDTDNDGEPDACLIAGRNGVLRLFNFETGRVSVA